MVLLISIFEMLSSYNSIVAKSSPTVPLHQLLFLGSSSKYDSLIL